MGVMARLDGQRGRIPLAVHPPPHAGWTIRQTAACSPHHGTSSAISDAFRILNPKGGISWRRLPSGSCRLWQGPMSWDPWANAPGLGTMLRRIQLRLSPCGTSLLLKAPDRHFPAFWKCPGVSSRQVDCDTPSGKAAGGKRYSRRTMDDILRCDIRRKVVLFARRRKRTGVARHSHCTQANVFVCCWRPLWRIHSKNDNDGRDVVDGKITCVGDDISCRCCQLLGGRTSPEYQ